MKPLIPTQDNEQSFYYAVHPTSAPDARDPGRGLDPDG
jgi:hypothetical protein